MKALLGFSRFIDSINLRLGRWMAWMIVLAVVISAANAVIRKVFNTSSNAWLEMQWVLFGAVFLLCSAWTLLENEHIRIDILNSSMPNWLRQAVEVVGHGLFLIPMALIMVVTSVPFFWRSFIGNEQSMNAGGLPQWPGKFLILAGFTFLLAQGISELIKRVAIIQGEIPETLKGGGHAASAEAEAERLLAIAKDEAEKHLASKA